MKVQIVTEALNRTLFRIQQDLQKATNKYELERIQIRFEEFRYMCFNLQYSTGLTALEEDILVDFESQTSKIFYEAYFAREAKISEGRF